MTTQDESCVPLAVEALLQHVQGSRKRAMLLARVTRFIGFMFECWEVPRRLQRAGRAQLSEHTIHGFYQLLSLSDREIQSPAGAGGGSRDKTIELCTKAFCPAVNNAKPTYKNGRFTCTGADRALLLNHVNLVAAALEIDLTTCWERWFQATTQNLVNKHKGELCSGVFLYKEARMNAYRSWRKYHPLISIRRHVRSAVLVQFGYRYQYDVKSCFATLLVQEWARYMPDMPLPCLSRIVEHPDAVRHAIAMETGYPVDAVKIALNALLMGAKLSALRREQVCAVFARRAVPVVLQLALEITSSVDDALAMYERFRTCEFVRNYVQEIKHLQSLPKLVEPEFFEKPGQLYWLAECLESMVRTAMANYIHDQGHRVFEIHDAVVSTLDIDLQALADEVLARTGYRVKLTREDLSPPNPPTQPSNQILNKNADTAAHLSRRASGSLRLPLASSIPPGGLSSPL